MARFPWTRTPAPVVEAVSQPEQVDRSGFVYGVPMGGTTEYNQGVTSSNSQDRRSQLTQLFEAYLTCPWSNACVDVVARTITAGGLEVAWNGDDEDEETPDAPPEVLELRALLDYVNPTMDIRQLCVGVLTDLEIFGDAFLEIVWFLGRPIALYPLDVPSMAIISDEHGQVSRYVQVTEYAQRAEFEPHEIIHFTLGSPRSGISGVSPTSKALLPITVWLFTAATLKEQMRKGDPATIHVDHPQAMPEQEVQKWRAQYAVQNLGPRNIGAPITTRGGGSVKELGAKKVENYLKTLDQKRDEIVSVYGVPPHQVGIIESGNLGGGTGTTQFKNYLVNKCDPLAQIVLEKLNFHLAVKGFGIDLSQWLLRFGSMDWRDDKVIDEIASTRLRDGRWTLNRSRKEIGEPPVDGGDDPVLVDRQNLVLWSDMADMSAAVVSKTGSAAMAAGVVPAVKPADGEDETARQVRAGRLLEQYRARQRDVHRSLARGDDVGEATDPAPVVPPTPIELTVNVASPEVQVTNEVQPTPVEVAAPVVTVEAPPPAEVTVDVQPAPVTVQAVPGAPVTIDLPAPPRTTRTTVTRNDDGSMTSVVEPEPDVQG